MSFSVEVKEDILKVNTDNKSRILELESLLRFGGEIVLGRPLKLVFSCSNMHVLRYFISLVKQFYSSVSTEVASRQMQKLNHQTIYSCYISDGAKDIIDDLGILDPVSLRKDEILNDPVLMVAYLKGAFLIKGTVNNPLTSNYHLEMSTDKETEALFLQRCMNYFSLNARISKRRNHLIVYIKEKDAIVEFLRRIGANVSMNEFENTVIKRTLAANINRVMNIDVANQQKTNASAKEQIKYIKYLEFNYPLEKLDPKILMVMKVRKENPEASLLEMVDIINSTYDEEITKSGLNHRLRKIKEIAIDFEERKKAS